MATRFITQCRKQEHIHAYKRRCQRRTTHGDSAVRFAGYRIPHPLVLECHIRVETMHSKLTPQKVFEASLVDLQQETDHLKVQFEDACEDFERSQGI